MRNPNPEQLAAMQRAAAQRQLAQRISCELLVFVVLLIPICILEYVIEPTTRGFFCDDESIRYPFLAHTVTPLMLGLLVGTLPVLIFVVVEYLRHKWQPLEISESKYFFYWRITAWCVEIVRQIVYFSFGLLLTLNATEVGKYTIGRLRPHFMAVCQPQLTDGSTCSDAHNLHRYVENYYCAAEGFTLADVRQARLSFPSGHSSLAFYAMLYVAFYLQRRLRWRNSQLARHFIQFLLVMLAWFVALSRVMDNWHHWSDVVIGSAIGIACALITARYIAKFFNSNYSYELQRNLSSLQRQDTTATLEEVCTSHTPPPSFITDDQFTKV